MFDPFSGNLNSSMWRLSEKENKAKHGTFTAFLTIKFIKSNPLKIEHATSKLILTLVS